MLILTRKTGTAIILEITEEENGRQLEDPIKVTITVTNIQSNQCKLGIDAPQTVRIIRDELIAKD